MSLAARLKTRDILTFDEFNVYIDEFLAYENCLCLSAEACCPGPYTGLHASRAERGVD